MYGAAPYVEGPSCTRGKVLSPHFWPSAEVAVAAPIAPRSPVQAAESNFRPPAIQDLQPGFTATVK